MKFVEFTKQDVDELLEVDPFGKPAEGSKLRFYRISIEGTRELVYAKKVGEDMSLRIYSTVENGLSRPKGTDAIRVVLFWKEEADSVPKLIGMERKVLRVEGWRNNLLERIKTWHEMLGPDCRQCKSPTVYRKGRGKNSYFFGCVKYPECRGTAPHKG